MKARRSKKIPLTESETCRCPCHLILKVPVSIVHIAPCCELCPQCHREIVKAYLPAHIERCKAHTADQPRDE
jgi:hypothetical protein